MISSPIIKVSEKARKRFESCLLSLCSSWGAPGAWTLSEFRDLFAVPVFWGKLGTVPTAHVTLRAGLGQPQAVFLHVWHGWDIMGRGVQGGASTSQASTALFSSPRTGWTFCCPGICPAQASSWRNEQLSLKVISELLAVSGCLTASYRARVLVPWVLRI